MWLRCQFHAHTTNSDGDPLPVALCDHYADLGFDGYGVRETVRDKQHTFSAVKIAGDVERSVVTELLGTVLKRAISSALI